MSHRRKLLLIGWDAADWKVITPLLDEGKMPNLARLIDSGVMGNLATLYPVLSPMLWTSIATGKRAWKHGVHGFTEPDPRTGKIRPISNLARNTKALWNILNQNGLKSNVIGWWPSHPAEPINGVMVSDGFCKAMGESEAEWPMRPGTVHPPQLADPLKKLRIHPYDLEGEQILPFVPSAAEIDQQQDKRLFSIGKIFAECSSVHAAATAVIQLEPWDFMAVYYDAIDHFCHGFMKYHPPRQEWIDERDFELYSEVVTAAYRFHDLMLGALIQLAPDDTTFVVVSDHGFHSDHLRPREIPNEPAGPADEHRHFGMIVMSGPGIKRDELVFGAGLLDIAPTILHLFDLPIGRDMDGKPLTGALVENGKQPSKEVTYIDSWDDIDGDDGRHPVDLQVDPFDAHEAMQQLVALGYVESPDADEETATAHTVRELRYNLARAYIGGRRLPEAIEILEELWQQWPEEQRFGVQIFDACLGLGRTAEARGCLDRIVANKQEYSEKAREELAEFQEQLKKRAQERGDSNQDPPKSSDGNAEPADAGGEPFELTLQDQQQLRRLRARTQTNPYTLAYLNGVLLLAENRPHEALGELKKASEVQMRNQPDVYDRIGQVYLRLRRWVDAEQQYEQMLEIDPVSAAARLGLARSLLPRRQFSAALDQATASIGLIYFQPLAHYLCGVALLHMKQPERAAQAFRTAIEQNPTFPRAHLHLARIYERDLNEADLGRRHRELASQARRQIDQSRSGRLLPERQESDLPLSEVATLGDIGNTEKPGPLGEDEIVIVSGLPRSGTSMMMQMLAAGGLPVLTDQRRTADENNPRGYFELEAAKRLASDKAWLTEANGKAVKVVVQLLTQLPLDHRYRIVFMERPLKEVVASQAEMLSRGSEQGNGLRKPTDPARLALTYQRQVNDVRRILAQCSERFSVLSVSYHDALADASAMASRVNRFFGSSLNQDAMAAAIDPLLRHQKG